MQKASEPSLMTFVERWKAANSGSPRREERRQFQDSREHLSSEVRELAAAVDEYKIRHRRRFITFEELYDVMIDLGYHK